MIQAIQDLITISHTVGNQLDLVQGGGGNTSVKADGTMYIKASGTPLKAMSESSGWVTIPSSGDEQHPSMEWPMHLLLPRVVIHVHAVYLNIYNCQVGGVEKLASLLTQFEPIVIPYATPGQELAASIQQRIQGMNPTLLLLENHGVIVCGEHVNEVLARLNAINDLVKADCSPFIVTANPPLLSSLFPDAAVLEKNTDVQSANAYVHQQIAALGCTVQPLPPHEGDKLRAMEQEQYRIHLN
ncbi:MAG: class II aldolase/adducin family protein [Candidatus Kerfeldbacteria bacterium]|nr:class II aldolase/adducin family protein [Candidatus Kerfeldbacteria bacterium]